VASAHGRERDFELLLVHKLFHFAAHSDSRGPTNTVHAGSIFAREHPAAGRQKFPCSNLSAGKFEANVRQ
jgi:hypothetical protein